MRNGKNDKKIMVWKVIASRRRGNLIKQVTYAIMILFIYEYIGAWDFYVRAFNSSSELHSLFLLQLSRVG